MTTYRWTFSPEYRDFEDQLMAKDANLVADFYRELDDALKLGIPETVGYVTGWHWLEPRKARPRPMGLHK